MMQPEMDTITPAEVRPVRVAACPGPLRDRIGRSIAGAAPARTPIFFDRVEEALAADDQAAVLVPLRMPRAHVAAALTAGADADSALRDWRRQAEAVLTGCRRARRRVVVVDADLFVAGAADGAADAAARLGVDLASASGAHRARDDGTDVHAALAAALVATDLRAQELFDELEAMATGPVTPCLPDRADVAAALRATMAVAEERDHLRGSLHEAVAEADRLRMEGAGLSRDLEQRDTALAELRQEAAAGADALAQSDAARSRLEAELREAPARATRWPRSATFCATACARWRMKRPGCTRNNPRWRSGSRRSGPRPAKRRSSGRNAMRRRGDWRMSAGRRAGARPCWAGSSSR